MKKIVIIILNLFAISNSFSQQISDGYARGISDYTIPLTSGVYGGLNAIGGIPDASHSWNHIYL